MIRNDIYGEIIRNVWNDTEIQKILEAQAKKIIFWRANERVLG